ncbi:HAD-IA family hydrolase [Kitasatospora atroaurantiaca]|uniref:Phosphoglycolate phosphatase-like HAD superfamily hydrolase n=1 Tax=Kitasatospora atroaurantiaca TaxID=285545 RepID=A0A561EPQ5_9ACTN|nr:HAD hydrolase-like protein [Kitasatospora atroaurantiaca]TWE17591.1 phosphoglycolate phosphatase-like HAD superfamily hydrolase [Kitasatospora atroaurantiaca]
MRTHIVWDWNGTLLHDMEAVVAASNAAFATLGMAPITVERYRELYCFPIPKFYELLLGRVPSRSEWEVLDATFQEHYSELSVSCGLTAGARELLAEWVAAGRSQSLLSMHEHHRLVPQVRAHGIERHFVRVDGRVGTSEGEGKSVYLQRHLEALGAVVDPRRTVLIGDAADDGMAALAAGARAVLYTGGSHTRAKLEPLGVPVVDSLAEAVELAEQLVA